MADDEGGVSRRGLLAAGAGAGVGGVTGVLYFGGWLTGGGDGTDQIAAAEPDGDGESDLGELRYLLESLDQAEHTVSVTSFTYEDDVITVRYESDAASQSGYRRWRTHVGELGHVVWSYARYVADDGPDLPWPPGSSGGTATAEGEGTASRPTTVSGVTEAGDGEIEGVRLIAEIENPYTVEDEDSDTPTQPDSYAVERRWVLNWIHGAWTRERLVNTVANTRVGTRTTTSG